MNMQSILHACMAYWHKNRNPIMWTKTSEQFYLVLKRYLDKSDHLIELGSGTGHVSYFLAKEGFSVTLNDIRKECLDETRATFRLHHAPALYIPGSLFSIKKTYDFCWNSGLIQCFPKKGQELFIKKLSTLARKVVIFYPDTEHPAKQRGTNVHKIHGVDDAIEYPVSSVPMLMSTYFHVVHVGTLEANDIGLPYPMYWMYGENI